MRAMVPCRRCGQLVEVIASAASSSCPACGAPVPAASAIVSAERAGALPPPPLPVLPVPATTPARGLQGHWPILVIVALVLLLLPALALLGLLLAWKQASVAEGEAPPFSQPLEPLELPVDQPGVFRHAGQLGNTLALAIDPPAQTAFLLTRDAALQPRPYLQHCSYPGLQLQRSYRIDAPAHQAALDGPRGLLYVGTGTRYDEDRAEQPTRGDIHVYNVRAIMAGQPPAENRLRPVAVIALEAALARMLLSPDGAWLYVLDATNRQGVRLVRIDTAQRAPAGEVMLGPGKPYFCRSRDGKHLYVALASTLLRINAATLTTQTAGFFGLTACGVAARDDGTVFVACTSGLLRVVNLSGPQPVEVARWALSGTLHLSPDEQELHVVQPQALVTLKLPARLTRQPPPPQRTQAGLDRRHWLGLADSQLTPDGHYIVSLSGEVYQHTSKKPALPVQPVDPPPVKLAASPKETPLNLVTELDPFPSITADRQSRRLLVGSRTGFLKLYSLPDFQPRGLFLLGQAAHQLALDDRQGLLYAAVIETHKLGSLDPEGIAPQPGELCIYDVQSVLVGQTRSGELQPLARLPFPGRLAAMRLSSDGAWLDLLHIQGLDQVGLSRLNCATRQFAPPFSLAGKPMLLLGSPDGQSLYAMGLANQSESLIHELDPATLRLRRTVWLPMRMKEAVALNGGWVLVSVDGAGIRLIDMSRCQAAADWEASRWRLAVSTDSQRLFLSMGPSRLEVAALPERLPDGLPTGLAAGQAPARAVGPPALRPPVGRLFLTPDGQFVIGGNGGVARSPELEPVAARPRSADLSSSTRLPAQGDDLEPAGKLEPFLAAVADPEAKALWLITRDRALKHYSYPDFQPRGSYRLAATGYRAVLDSSRNRLFVAAADPEPPLPKGRPEPLRLLNDVRASGPLHVYDVAALRQGALKDGAELKPAAEVLSAGTFSRLLLAPDRAVYCLDVADARNVRLSRIDLLTQQRQELRLEDHTNCLALTPDGQTLIAGAPVPVAGKSSTFVAGKIQRIEAADLRRVRTAVIEQAPHDLVATNDLQVIVSTRFQAVPTVVVDMKESDAVIARWSADPFVGSAHLLLDSTGKRLYQGAIYHSPTFVSSFDLPPTLPGLPTLVKSERPKQSMAQATMIYLTPDGRFLLTAVGEVFRLSAP